MSRKTELHRKIPIAALNRPRFAQSEVIDGVGCPSLYVMGPPSGFDSIDAISAEVERTNRELGVSRAGPDNGWAVDPDPNRYRGEECNEESGAVSQDGVEGPAVLTKETKGPTDGLGD